MIDTTFNNNYLLTEENLPKLFALIDSGDESNVALCLEMIIGSEPHPFLTGIACGIYLCTDDKALENRVLDYLDLHLKNELQAFPHKINTDMNECYDFLEEHDSIDYCGCAYILWKYYSTRYLNTIFILKNVKPSRLEHIHFLKNCYLRFISINLDNEEDDIAFFQIFKDFNITRLHQILKSDYFPKHLIQLTTLKHLYFEAFHRSSKSYLTIPKLPTNPSNNALYKIDFGGLELVNIENLIAFQNIKALNFRNLPLHSTTFLSEMPQLTRLYFDNCGLVVFPNEIAVMRDLTYLHLSNNKIEIIDFDFNIFPSLRDLMVNEKNLKSEQHTHEKWLLKDII